MPKVICKCDNIISLSDIPSPHQSLMISDMEYNKFWESIDAEKLYKAMTLVVHCDKCMRLLIYKDGFDKEPTVYTKELL